MSLDKWLARGKPIMIGGREFLVMPLPLTRLHELGIWLETNCKEVVREFFADAKAEKPNPLVMVSKVLMRVDTAEVIHNLLITPKNPETREPINSVTLDFISEYLDVPSAHEFYTAFVEVNDLESLLKNLQRLPIVKNLMEAASLTFGIPFLSSLEQSTVSHQKRSEGLPSRKSTATSAPVSTGAQEAGKSKDLGPKVEDPKTSLVQ